MVKLAKAMLMGNILSLLRKAHTLTSRHNGSPSIVKSNAKRNDLHILCTSQRNTKFWIILDLGKDLIESICLGCKFICQNKASFAKNTQGVKAGPFI